MAVVTGNTFTEQKLYSPSSMPLIASVVQLGEPMFVSPVVYPYETGGTTVANPTTFIEQVTYSPSSLFEGNYISQYGDPLYNQVYNEIGMMLTEQTLYAPASLSIADSQNSSNYAVTGLTPPPAQFWS